jgi:tetratricopeptide (TPR) repeat protein
LVGWVHQWRRIPGPIWLLLTLYPLSIILVFVAARYRTPLVPVISVLAAAGCLALVSALRSRNLLRLATHGGLVGAAVAVTCLPGPFPRERVNYAAELHRLLANRLFAEQRIDQAIQQYRLALDFEPDDPDIHGRLGEAMLRQGRLEEAIVHYTASLRVRPDSATNRACLGIALQQNDQLEQAIA